MQAIKIHTFNKLLHQIKVALSYWQNQARQLIPFLDKWQPYYVYITTINNKSNNKLGSTVTGSQCHYLKYSLYKLLVMPISEYASLYSSM